MMGVAFLIFLPFWLAYHSKKNSAKKSEFLEVSAKSAAGPITPAPRIVSLFRDVAVSRDTLSLKGKGQRGESSRLAGCRGMMVLSPIALMAPFGILIIFSGRDEFLMGLLTATTGLIALVPLAKATIAALDLGVDYRVVFDRSKRTVTYINRRGPFTVSREVTGTDFALKTQTDPGHSLPNLVVSLENGREVAFKGFRGEDEAQAIIDQIEHFRTGMRLVSL